MIIIKQIDIIIPVYNTDKSYLIQCLTSIALQRIKGDVSVIIVDDASSCSYDDIINDFSRLIDIKYVKLEHNVGVGKARQHGLDISNSPYVAFIDSDDALYNEYSLEILYDKILEKNYDFVSGSFLREHYSDNCSVSEMKLSKVGKNQTWVFSRLFSREFLKSKHIQFNEMRFNEDVYFMSLAICQSNSHAFVDNTIYVQHCNLKSLTRSDNSEFRKGANGTINFIKALSYAHMRKRELGIVNTECSKTQMTDGLAVCYWYFIKVYNENTIEVCERFLKVLQCFYNMVIEDFPAIKKSGLLAQSYHNSCDSMSEVSRAYIPNISFVELLNDLEENRNKIEDVSKYGYELG